MVRIEINGSLKTLPRFFKFIALCFGKLARIQIILIFLFENALDILLLLFYKHFVHDKILHFYLGEF